MNYSVIYVKTTDAEETMEFGLEAFDNGATSGANTFGFGDNRLYYLGPEAAYTSATEADYNAIVAEAKDLIAKYGPKTVDDPLDVDATVGWITYKLMRYIGDEKYPWAEGFGYTAPTTLQDKQNIILSLREYIDILKLTTNPELLGIEELTSAPQTAVRQQSGTYTLSGVRVSGKNLPAGLYIVNGKKVIVK